MCKKKTKVLLRKLFSLCFLPMSPVVCTECLFSHAFILINWKALVELRPLLGGDGAFPKIQNIL